MVSQNLQSSWISSIACKRHKYCTLLFICDYHHNNNTRIPWISYKNMFLSVLQPIRNLWRNSHFLNHISKLLQFFNKRQSLRLGKCFSVKLRQIQYLDASWELLWTYLRGNHREKSSGFLLILNPLNCKSDQHQISSWNIST